MLSRSRVLGFLAALPIWLTGCASTGADVPSAGSPAAAPGISMSPGMSMPGMHNGMHNGVDNDMDKTAGPSEPARMICSEEIRENVARVFKVGSVPPAQDTWLDRIYTCTYRLPAGPLVLSVKDSPGAMAGQRYFTGLRKRAQHAQPLRGLLGLGLPSFQTRRGTVVFLKDGKTLTVDATDLPPMAGPNHQSRTDVAYAVAAGVVACWTEEG